MAFIEITTLTDAEAAKLTSENKHGHIWKAGLHVTIDDQSHVLKSRDEAEQLIAEIAAAADRLWPHE